MKSEITRQRHLWTANVPDSLDDLLTTSFTSAGLPVFTGAASGDGAGAQRRISTARAATPVHALCSLASVPNAVSFAHAG